MKKIIYFILGFALFFPVLALAKIGVGIGTGKITMDQALKPGLVYTLPALVVLNTGDEPSDYGVAVAYNENQTQMKPIKEWFSFRPSQFHLEPNQSRTVEIKLNLPIKNVKPGEYFAYLQGYPAQKSSTGGTSVGIAAAAKLYFTVAPSNFLMGIYYRLISLLALYSPLSYVALAVMAATLLITIACRFVSLNISFKGRK